MEECAFVRWPEIEALHNVLRNRRRSREHGESSPSTSSTPSSSLIGYKGKIKLHGANGAIVLRSSRDGLGFAFRIQSRNKFIDDEERGLSKWAKSNSAFFNDLHSRIYANVRHDVQGLSIAIFGEWAGPGIQKMSEVAIGQIPTCIFAVFAIHIDDYLVVEPDDITRLLGSYGLPEGMHVLPWSFEYMRLDLDNEQQLEAQLPKINQIVDEVDELDPWVLNMFDIRGPGEGVVWYPVTLGAKSLGGCRNVLSSADFCGYAFKTKGKRHQMVKTKPSAGTAQSGARPGKGKAPVDGGVSLKVAVVDSAEELADLFLTEARFEQALHETAQVEGASKSVESFAEELGKWMKKDVRKEAVAEFEAASRPLNWNDVDAAVTQKVGQWASIHKTEIDTILTQGSDEPLSKSKNSTALGTSKSKWSYSTETSFDLDSTFTFDLSGPSSSSSSATSDSNLFEGLTFCFSEHFSSKSKANLTKLIKSNRGAISYSLTENCTHLLATQKEVDENLSVKVRNARKMAEGQPIRSSGGLKGSNASTMRPTAFRIIDGGWIEECISKGSRVPEFNFDFLAKDRMRLAGINGAAPKAEETTAREERESVTKVHVWLHGAKDEPYFPTENYDIIRTDVLHAMDFEENANKFYEMELHASNDYQQEGRYMYRILTHHGRTDYIHRPKRGGQRECRYLKELHQAEQLYDYIMGTKVADDKGYFRVHLLSTSPLLGSDKSRQKAEQEQVEAQKATKNDVDDKNSSLPQQVQDLVRYLYQEASESVSRTVIAKITTRGIETPLGILSHQQIQIGEDVLMQLYHILTQSKSDTHDEEKVAKLSQQFYSLIPHYLGINKEEVRKSILNSVEAVEEKQNLLQLMKDIIQVNNMRSRSSSRSDIDRMYNALECEIVPIVRDSSKFTKLETHFLKRKDEDCLVSDKYKPMQLKVANIYRIKRGGQEAVQRLQRLKSADSNSMLLFHGSKVCNFVGLLSRGILLPKIVVSRGLTSRTDFGYLGQGIYYADCSYSSVKYTKPAATTNSAAATAAGKPNKRKGRQQAANGTGSGEDLANRRLMLMAKVDAGKPKPFFDIASHLSEPPQGFDSCWGVAARRDAPSAFMDDEYVIYDPRRQQLKYLVEFNVISE